MTDQPSLFDDGERARDEALTRVTDHADPAWLKAAADVILALPAGTEWTTDQVWARLVTSGVSTHEPRALGAVVRRLALAGQIAKTGRYVPSARPECHARPIPIWRRATPRLFG